MNTAGRRVLAGITLVLSAIATMLLPTAAFAATPAPPTNLRVTALSFTWLTLAWNGPAGTASYVVSIDTPPGVWQAQTAATSQSFGGLNAGTVYTASVRTVDNAGHQSAAATVTFTTLPRTQPAPAAPANLRAVYANGTLHSIAWDPPVYPLALTYTLHSGPEVISSTSATSVTIAHLIHNECAVEPGGTYTLSVRAWAPDNYPSLHSSTLTITVA